MGVLDVLMRYDVAISDFFSLIPAAPVVVGTPPCVAFAVIFPTGLGYPPIASNWFYCSFEAPHSIPS